MFYTWLVAELISEKEVSKLENTLWLFGGLFVLSKGVLGTLSECDLGSTKKNFVFE